MRKFFALALFVFLAFNANAQSAEKITEIIDSPEATGEQAAYLAAVYSGLCQESASMEDCLAAAAEKNWIDSSKGKSQIKLKELCFLYAKALNVKGGLFYRMTKSPRYAFKEFKAMGLLDKAADPDMSVQGQNALNLLNSLAQRTEAAQ